MNVLLFPPDKNPFNVFLVARAPTPDYTPPFDARWACQDSSFGDLFDSAVMQFASASDAIQWCEQAPRRWNILNKVLYRSTPPVWPQRIRVTVLGAGYTPGFALHETTERRRDAGEQVLEVEIGFEAIEPLTPLNNCKILIDAPALAMLARSGISSPEAMRGRILTLETADPADIFRPLRLVRIS